ncbi:C-C motif chemokine 20 [Pygocentrus nattereri]|uniref:C-C motif chemokine n=1 Tax=Pygocentrus nattereri TaxID=42514 RepID=A0AAR2IPG8_PYGNA|nr:C-C motif chemokine 20 [Pygocentrus nattereri]
MPGVRASLTDLEAPSSEINKAFHQLHHLVWSLSTSASDSFRYTMTKLFLVLPTALVLLCVWVSLGEASPVKCCTTFSLNPLPLNRLKHFAIQDATTVCRLNAVIFTTVKNRKICANPDAQWVKNAVSHLKNKEKPTEASSEAV